CLNFDTRLWVAEEPEQTQDADDTDQVEALFYDQPAQILAAVARAQSAPSGTTGVYFVGFAGDGEQAVFKRETLFASRVFAERFGSGERSVLLVNDVEDRDSYPLAGVSGLAQTLKVLAPRMHADDDVLVLFLTSHGSRDGLEVENGSLPLSQLAPTDLRQALDDSEIRWRVVVVSACYAGVFLDELRATPRRSLPQPMPRTPPSAARTTATSPGSARPSSRTRSPAAARSRRRSRRPPRWWRAARTPTTRRIPTPSCTWDRSCAANSPSCRSDDPGTISAHLP